MSSSPPASPKSTPLAPESVAHLRFFKAMDRVNRAILGASDGDPMLSHVLDACLDIFGSHRVWLVAQTDPKVPVWRLTAERTRPLYPSPFRVGHDVPNIPSESAAHVAILSQDTPVCSIRDGQFPFPPGFPPSVGYRSQIAMAIYPQGDHPHIFGMHQCDHEREWSPDEVRLFQQIGRRIADALTSVRAFRNLEDSEELYRGILDNATDSFFLLDERGVIEDVNRSATARLGYTREELIGQTLSVFDPDLTPEKLAAFARRIEAGGEIILDTRNRRKDGSEIPVELRARRMDREDGGFSAVTLLRDMTERRSAEIEIERSERRLRSFFETANAAMIEISATGRIVNANDIFSTMTGYTMSEIREMRIHDFLFPEDVAAMVTYWSVLRDGRSEHDSREFRYRRKDGSALIVLAYTAVLGRDASGAPLAAGSVLIDLTERKRLEEHLQRAQKMEAIGQLAGGVAHDFNNLLTVINGYSEILFASLPTHDHLRDAAAAIRDAGERAGRLTSQLLAFSRKAIVEPKVLDLNAVIETTRKMLGRLVGEGVELKCALAKPLSAVRADAGQIEQVLLNLAVNARDAMPKGGALTISTGEIEIGPEAEWEGEEIRPGRHVRLRVADTGTGMTEEVRARLFEPFFTTKGIGRGTGLGLATVYGIVRQAGGQISAESRLGQGSVFTVLLPAVTANVTAAVTEPRTSSHGSETILLVEDEPAVRKLTRKILERHGYTVIEASDGDEGLRIAEAHTGTIDLLLTDVVMPSLGGRDLAEALRAKRPAIKVLFMTGFTDDAVIRHGISTAADALLQKPFTPAALTHKLRLILDEKDFPESV